MAAKKHKSPSFVPPKVQAIVDHLLNGDASGTGWLSLQNDIRREIAAVKDGLKEAVVKGERMKCDSLRRRIAELTLQLRSISDDIDCLDRLTMRYGMEKVYVTLETELDGIDDIWAFIHAAHSARRELEPHREAIRSANKVKRDIEKTSLKLAELLGQLVQTGIQPADELQSTRDLLRKAEVREQDKAVWQIMRQHLLPGSQNEAGVTAIASADTAETSDDEDIQDLEGEFVIDEIMEGEPPAPDHAANIRYAWGIAPSPVNLINALAKAAEEFKPQEYGPIGAATNVRQSSVKAEYIRVFAEMLAKNDIPLSPSVMDAMADTATVVLNEPDLVVTYKDVDNTLNRPPK